MAYSFLDYVIYYFFYLITNNLSLFTFSFIMEANIDFKRAINLKAHRKSDKFSEAYLGLVVVGDKIETAVDIRVYVTDVRTYCCVWIYNNKDYCDGSGYVEGYGYDKISSAISVALKSAGVELSESINGRGESAIKSAIIAILDFLYPEAKIKQVLKVYG